jgi:predicted nucleic acid-binding protein
MVTCKRLVPDASVILKWVLPKDKEPHFEEAQAILGNFHNGFIDLLVPTIWIYEVGNLLGRKYPDEANRLITNLEAIGFKIIAPYPEWRQQALSLMKQYRVTFYDAAYHALAMTENALFVTADVAYIRKVGNQPEIMNLSDWLDQFPALNTKFVLTKE